jgi:hypothetical protein
VRLAYLDEAGISRNEPALCVAGVLVHGDRQSMEIEQQLDLVREEHIPEADRDKVIFHATDIYHGSGYFDRRKPEWMDENRRWAILVDLAGIINAMSLPIVAGTYEKATFAEGVLRFDLLPHDKQHEAKKFFIHTSAAVDCAIWTDRWLEKYAPSENAIIIAEDNDYIKKMLKRVVHILRNKSRCISRGFDVETLDQLGLPLKRIIDTPHFTEKVDAPALQLADLVAFTAGRLSKKKHVVPYCGSVLLKQVSWVSAFKKAAPISTESDAERSS